MSRHSLALVAITAVGFATGVISPSLQRSERAMTHPAGGAISTLSISPARSQAASGELVGAALGALLDNPDLAGLARLGDVLPLLRTEQVKELLDRLHPFDSDSPSARSEWLFSWLLTHNKSAATAWITPRLVALAQDGPAEPHPENSRWGKIFRTWAAAAPEEAFEVARDYPRSGLGGELLSAAIRAWPEREGSARLAALLGFPAGRARAGAFETLFLDWAKQDPNAAFASAQAVVAEGERDRGTAAVVRTWAETDAAAAFAAYQSGGMKDIAVLSAVLENLARTDPRYAIAALATMSSEDLSRCSPKVVSELAKHDPAAALSWAMERGFSLGRRVEKMWSQVEHSGGRLTFSIIQHFISSPLATAIESQPDATLTWLRALPTGTERERMYELAAFAARDHHLALDLFSTLGPEARERAAYGLAQRFAGTPEIASKWIETLPDGPVRFQAMAGLGASGQAAKPTNTRDRDAWWSGHFESAPHSAGSLEHLVNISDPVLRNDIFQRMFETVRGSPEERERVIDKAMDDAGLSEEWKRQLTDEEWKRQLTE